jgi:PEP-CTERM motif
MTTKFKWAGLAMSAALALTSTSALASSLITFSDFAGGPTYGFDSNGDSIADVVFSGQPSFGQFGPGNQSFVSPPGLEGSTEFAPDVRVDFSLGATSSLGFGFAALASGNINSIVTFSAFDASDVLLGSITADGMDFPGGFTEGLVSLNFSGIASYATIDFTLPSTTRFFIDNFTLNTAAVPEPASWALMIAGFGLVGGAMRRRGATTAEKRALA